VRIAYRKLTDALFRLTDGEKWNENLSELPTNGLKKERGCPKSLHDLICQVEPVEADIDHR